MSDALNMRLFNAARALAHRHQVVIALVIFRQANAARLVIAHLAVRSGGHVAVDGAVLLVLLEELVRVCLLALAVEAQLADEEFDAAHFEQVAHAQAQSVRHAQPLRLYDPEEVLKAALLLLEVGVLLARHEPAALRLIHARQTVTGEEERVLAAVHELAELALRVVGLLERLVE